MQVDLLHWDDLGITAAGRAPFHAEYRAEGGFPQGQNSIFAQQAHAVRQADGDGRFPLSRRRGVNGRYQYELAFFAEHFVRINLCHHIAEWIDRIRRNIQL